MSRTRRSPQHKAALRRVSEESEALRAAAVPPPSHASDGDASFRDPIDEPPPPPSAPVLLKVGPRHVRRRFDSASFEAVDDTAGSSQGPAELAAPPPARDTLPAAEPVEVKSASLKQELLAAARQALGPATSEAEASTNGEVNRADSRRPQLYVALTMASPESVDDDEPAEPSPRLLPKPASEPQRPSEMLRAVEPKPAEPKPAEPKPAEALSRTVEPARPALRASTRESARPVVAEPVARPFEEGGPTLELRELLVQARNSAGQAELGVRTLAEQIRAVSQRQHHYERKYVLNSVFAYVIFCALIFAGLYFVFDMRSAKNVADAAYYEAEFDRLAQRLEIAESELERHRQAAHLAFEIFQLMEQARYQEALDRYVQVQDKLINPAENAMLEARVDTLKWKMADDAYREGLSLFANGEYEQARDAFFRSVAQQAETPYSHLLAYYLGTCLYELGDFEGARNYLKTALAAKLPSDLDAEARYLYAVATEKVGSFDEAFELYETFLKRNRFHKHADDVTRRLGKLERLRAKPSGTGTVAPAPEPEAP